ncbi:hypothetical protein D8674_006619 [Pyrus ussuriensis x Pyrus communis]|uniref:RING-type domain-containing protein n=1 Tax=Pyrus ussuriensis x Pyrus communis TaxID=2448454 RepID=A0A5N5G0H8_9ROSA|nr:hypothetical protein D8674_006619 [Pyrus ussuriensis x Pyrus communis]
MVSAARTLPPSPSPLPPPATEFQPLLLLAILIPLVAILLFFIVKTNADERANQTHDIESGTLTQALNPGGRRRVRIRPLQRMCFGIPFFFRLDKKIGICGDDCVICMEEFDEGDKCRVLKCKHNFHQECIEKWLATASKCPLCCNSVLC